MKDFIESILPKFVDSLASLVRRLLNQVLGNLDLFGKILYCCLGLLKCNLQDEEN